jgi:hypothetical protein
MAAGFPGVNLGKCNDSVSSKLPKLNATVAAGPGFTSIEQAACQRAAKNSNVADPAPGLLYSF